AVRTLSRLRASWPPLAGLALLTLVLLPARFATLRGDDIWTFQARGLVELEGRSYLSDVVDRAGQVLASARPLVLGSVQGQLTIWVFEGHPMAYRLFLVALTVAAAALLYRLVIALGAPPLAGLLALVLLGAAVQFRGYHDA